jgi:hypothetical protein
MTQPDLTALFYHHTASSQPTSTSLHIQWKNTVQLHSGKAPPGQITLPAKHRHPPTIQDIIILTQMTQQVRLPHEKKVNTHPIHFTTRPPQAYIVQCHTLHYIHLNKYWTEVTSPCNTLNIIYEACPESIEPYLISREPVA